MSQRQSIIARVRAGCIVLAALALWPAAAWAGDESPAIELSGEATVDLAGVVVGGSDGRLRVLSNVDLVADLDLARLVGWDGGGSISTCSTTAAPGRTMPPAPCRG